MPETRYSGDALRRYKVVIPRWLLPWYDFECDVYETWLSRRWWVKLWDATYRRLLRIVWYKPLWVLGVYHKPEGEVWRNGWLCWPPNPKLRSAIYRGGWRWWVS